MSHPSNIQQPQPQPQPPYTQYQQYPYYQQPPLHPFNNQYAFQSTQQTSYHYHFPPIATKTNRYHNEIKSEPHHNIIPNHTYTENNTFNQLNQTPQPSQYNHIHSSLKNNQNTNNNDKSIIITDQKQQQHYNNHSKSEIITIHTDPIIYINTHDIIQHPIMKELIKRSSRRLTQIGLRIKDLCVIGDHLWLREQPLYSNSNLDVFKKIKAHKFKEWMQWIKQQLPHYIDNWKYKICTVHSAEMVLETIIKNNKYNQQLINCIRLYKSRLMNFCHAFRKLYGIKVKTRKFKKPRKKAKLKLKSKCWRCGKGNHKFSSCHSKTDINGYELSEKCIELRFKSQNNIDMYQQNDESLQSCVKCGYVRCRCYINKKRTFSDIVDELEPVYKKQKIDDNAKQIQIKIESIDADMDSMNNVKADTAGICCSNCNIDLENKDVWRCSRCKTTFYCNRQCQLDHWKIHKIECKKSNDMDIKLEKICVDKWNHYGIIYWLNRVNDNMFNGLKYKYLRKHIVMGKIKGCDLLSINKVTLRMMGIDDLDEQNVILNAMSDVVMNGNFDNVLANRMKINDIPMMYVDPILYEVMNEPVKVMQSRYIYDKKFIEEYIEENKRDPMTQRYTDLSDIVACEELSIEIEKWKQQYLIPIA
eukprot:542666_1